MEPTRPPHPPIVMDLVVELVDIDAQIEQLNERRDALKTELAQQLPQGGQVGDIKVSVITPKTLNKKQLQNAYPVVQHPELYTPQLDVKKVRQHFSPVQLEEFQQAGRVQVRIK